MPSCHFIKIVYSQIARYINALEERIAFLEARLPEYGQDHFGQADSEKAVPADHTRNDSISETSPAEEDGEDDDSTLVDGVAYLSLCAAGTTDAAPEPFYMGSSSGANIARMIHSAIFRARKPSTISTSLNTLRSGSVSSVTSSVPTPLPHQAFVEFPPPAQAHRLFSVFFNRLHTRWPILDRKVYELVYEHQYEQGMLPITERSNLHLIYAIAARFMQLTKQVTDVDPEAHFAAAIEPMDFVMEQHNSSTVQFLTLLAIYGQRSPYGAGVWSQVRYAITLCVELGMHRKPSVHSPPRDPRDLEIRRRIFWSCYCLDRVTSILLGRTFAISDRDINVGLPSPDPVYWDLTSIHAPPPSTPPWSPIQPFIHIVKLRQLQSRIQRTVFRVDCEHTPPSQFDPKLAQIRGELDAWMASVPSPPPTPNNPGEPSWMYDPETSTQSSTNINLTTDPSSSSFFTLQYHKTILSLYTLHLPTLAPSSPRFQSCASSSATICTTYKRLHQQKILSFTIIGLHSCFVAGLTLIYCLWRDRALFSFSYLEATRACSQCLTVFGEKWPGAVKYGEIFEALSGSVLRAVMEAPPQQSPSHIGSKARTQKLELNLDIFSSRKRKQSTAAHNPLATPVSPSTATHQQGPALATATMADSTDPLLHAVKDVFMEVDEDLPGGLQGWRVFNEMVQSDIREPGLATGGISEAGGLGWSDAGIDGFSVQGMEMGVEEVWMGGRGRGSEGFVGGFGGAGDFGGGNGHGNGNGSHGLGWEHGFFAGFE
ncbi:fungal-specific transcription factor domain-containing protein [Dendryphion nanum]|uniref:Fungal-specific transcription factor domain-containing protein n=1 Tax=Dendryphion nanum TaxID=256645 RepID=A0A9P9E6Y2_9PLEO|nr:fungal-specific transcription factor domain-containing protein [Dendryphion nanum]